MASVEAMESEADARKVLVPPSLLGTRRRRPPHTATTGRSPCLAIVAGWCGRTRPRRIRLVSATGDLMANAATDGGVSSGRAGNNFDVWYPHAFSSFVRRLTYDQWPRVRLFRKITHSNIEAGPTRTAEMAKFVKVVVDSAGYLWKLNLQDYAGYDQLHYEFQVKICSHFTIKHRSRKFKEA